MSTNSVMSWIYGEKKPRPDTLKILASVVASEGSNITIEQLFDAAGVKMPPNPWETVLVDISGLPITGESKERIIQVIREEEQKHSAIS